MEAHQFIVQGGNWQVLWGRRGLDNKTPTHNMKTSSWILERNDEKKKKEFVLIFPILPTIVSTFQTLWEVVALLHTPLDGGVLSMPPSCHYNPVFANEKRNCFLVPHLRHTSGVEKNFKSTKI